LKGNSSLDLRSNPVHNGHPPVCVDGNLVLNGELDGGDHLDSIVKSYGLSIRRDFIGPNPGVVLAYAFRWTVCPTLIPTFLSFAEEGDLRYSPQTDPAARFATFAAGSVRIFWLELVSAKLELIRKGGKSGGFFSK
jgi:hypothetical protein